MEQVTAAVRERDTKGLVACFAEDAVLEVVHGTFRGKAEIARSFDWTWQMLPKLEYRDVGMGMRILDSMAVYEGVMVAVSADGTRLEALTLSTYEFNQNGKITRLVQVYNQWSAVQQSADQMSGLRDRCSAGSCALPTPRCARASPRHPDRNGSMDDKRDIRMRAIAELALAAETGGEVEQAVQAAFMAGVEPYEIAELSGLPMRRVLESLGHS
jgi:hypothetical protein